MPSSPPSSLPLRAPLEPRFVPVIQIALDAGHGQRVVMALGAALCHEFGARLAVMRIGRGWSFGLVLLLPLVHQRFQLGLAIGGQRLLVITAQHIVVHRQ